MCDDNCTFDVVVFRLLSQICGSRVGVIWISDSTHEIRTTNAALVDRGRVVSCFEVRGLGLLVWSFVYERTTVRVCEVVLAVKTLACWRGKVTSNHR